MRALDDKTRTALRLASTLFLLLSTSSFIAGPALAGGNRRLSQTSSAAMEQRPAPRGHLPCGPGSAAAAKQMPRIKGITVSLGDAHDSVKKAYPTASETPAGDLIAGGVRLFFTKDKKVLREIMVEAPFQEDVGGIRIGDSADDVVARRGKPDVMATVYGGTGYLYYVGGNILRYDVDAKSKKVTDIVQILSGR